MKKLMTMATVALLGLGLIKAATGNPSIIKNTYKAEGHKIGEFFGGGIVFHVFKDADGNEHGLIVSVTDQSDSKDWSQNTSDKTNAASTKDGLENTKTIVAAGNDKSAAGICDAYTSGEFSDWYLPAVDEMQLLNDALKKVNKAVVSVPNGKMLSERFYWTSTEKMNGSAWGFDFGKGASSSSNKLRNAYVRAIRAF